MPPSDAALSVQLFLKGWILKFCQEKWEAHGCDSCIYWRGDVFFWWLWFLRALLGAMAAHGVQTNATKLWSTLHTMIRFLIQGCLKATGNPACCSIVSFDSKSMLVQRSIIQILDSWLRFQLLLFVPIIPGTCFYFVLSPSDSDKGYQNDSNMLRSGSG